MKKQSEGRTVFVIADTRIKINVYTTEDINTSNPYVYISLSSLDMVRFLVKNDVSLFAILLYMLFKNRPSLLNIGFDTNITNKGGLCQLYVRIRYA